jgi:hypothetical protein
VHRLRSVVIYSAAAIFAVALVHRFRELGGPYFALPETIQDHVAAVPYPSRDAIVMSGRAAVLLPRRATVAVIMPSQAPNHDPTLSFVAVGMMPHQKIVGTDLGARPQYVIAIREPLTHPAYRLLRAFPEGNIYILR